MTEVLRDAWPVISLTLVVSASAVGISCAIGIPLGAWVGLSRFPGRSILKSLTFAGMATPPVVVGLVLYLLLSRSGVFGAWQWLFTPQAMILAQVILDLPFIIGITLTAIESLPDEFGFQLRALGATPWQVKWTMLRESRSSLMLAVMTALGRSLSEVGAVLMVGGNISGHTRVLTTAILLETNKGRFAMALWLAAVLMTFALVLNLILCRLQYRVPR